MERTSFIYNAYVNILKSELVPAMGCTEPIAVAYCAAKARKLLGELPERIEIYASGNIIKNVKSVIVPHSGGMRGLEAAAALGVLYGRADRELEVVASVTREEEEAFPKLMKQFEFSLEALDTDHVLDLVITLRKGDNTATVHIEDSHTNIVEEILNGRVQKINYTREESRTEPRDEDHSVLNVADIFDFAESLDISDVKEVLERQISYNSAIAREGLEKSYGACIGRMLYHRSDDVRTRAKAMASAGSDARMSGCDKPVIINSGSGNQGITASMPVVVYAEYYEKTKEELLRSLALSNLITLHLKSGIGRLSAYCGAVSAGAGAGAGIAYLLTRDLRAINHTIVNALAISSGIVCDGAKASCAAKIAMAVDAGIMGYDMHTEGCQFYGGDGLVSKGVENTIKNISALGHDGMKETDKKIIEIMTGRC